VVASTRFGKINSRWQLVLAALWLAWVTNLMVRSALAPSLVEIRSEFGLTHSQAGLLATSFLIGYTTMMLPGGIVGGWLGRRRMVIGTTLGWTLGALLIGLAPAFPFLIVSMGGLGLIMGLFNANDRPIVSLVTPRDKMGVGQGLSYTGLGVGNALGVMLAGALASAWGWRASYVAFSAVSLLAVVILWRTIPDLPREPIRAIWHAARPLLSSRDLWFLYLGGIPSVGAIWLLMTWTPTILLEATHLDLTTVSLLASSIGFAAVPALIGIGALSDWFVKYDLGRKAIIAVCHALLGISLAIAGIALDRQGNALIITGLLLTVGLIHWAAWAPTYALLAETVPTSALGVAFGLGATVWALGAMAIPWLAGLIRDLTGAFTWSLYGLAALAFIGALLLAAVKPPSDWVRRSG
jgi:predicted MFS family arabinose efflux permease